jgi:hypothetical protein
MATKTAKKELTTTARKELLGKLSARFEKNMDRHKGLKWEEIEARLTKKENKLWSLSLMEETGGEPDVVDYDKKTGEFTFCDCAPESPAGRRSYCYDKQALDSRKENKPKDSAMAVAESLGIELLNEEQYRALQKLGKFDLKTSSWVLTPPSIRKLGGETWWRSIL